MIQRYDVWEDANFRYVEESEDGEWCKWEDVEKELQTQRSIILSLQQTMSIQDAMVAKMNSELNRLREKQAEWTSEFQQAYEKWEAGV